VTGFCVTGDAGLGEGAATGAGAGFGAGNGASVAGGGALTALRCSSGGELDTGCVPFGLAAGALRPNAARKLAIRAASSAFEGDAFGSARWVRVAGGGAAVGAGAGSSERTGCVCARKAATATVADAETPATKTRAPAAA
jgi:hypothetical protein